MNLNEEYIQRTQEIEEFYNFLCFAEKIETYKINSKIYYLSNSFVVSSEFVKNLKAQFILLLYNLLESTVRCIISDVFDTVSDNHLKFEDLSMSLKKTFLEQEIKKDTSIKNIRNYFLEFVDKNENREIYLNIDGIDISGNIDMRQVRNLSEKVGFPNANIFSNKGVASSLLTIKNSRNNLAHGDFSFSNKGGIFTFSDLTKLKADTFSFLEELIRVQKNYIDKKMYLK